MSEMVERMARAICGSECTNMAACYTCSTAARRAIAAQDEPTEEMKSAGAAAFSEQLLPIGDRLGFDEEDAAIVWKAMNKAALGEGEAR